MLRSGARGLGMRRQGGLCHSVEDSANLALTSNHGDLTAHHSERRARQVSLLAILVHRSSTARERRRLRWGTDLLLAKRPTGVTTTNVLAQLQPIVTHLVASLTIRVRRADSQ